LKEENCNQSQLIPPQKANPCSASLNLRISINNGIRILELTDRHGHPNPVEQLFSVSLNTK
jgi:hypothetical protein